ncbi:unnamed protein product [Dracunculus medinensis]|uniref:Apple domain-containing protein n=1 Tax=Dracunculus medinensis TaxID=318479 RepID=A0A0N4ULW1_DRAME|nr:unnamed protein product [Dracunculus medinensis]
MYVTIYFIFIIFILWIGEIYSQYPSPSLSVFNTNASDNDQMTKPPEIPIAPPRVPAMLHTNNYRPPPPPTRRHVESWGTCKFDKNKWRIEPQAAVATAVMFDRTTGISCEDCLNKCMQMQAQDTRWICRTLTYDNKWQICDLFAINGTNYPYFLTDFPERDYFEYLEAKPIELTKFRSSISDPKNNESVSQWINDSNAENLNKALSTKSKFIQIHPKQTVGESVDEEEGTAYGDEHDYQAVELFSISPKQRANYMCKNNEITRYASIGGYLLANPGKETQFVPSYDPNECAKACDRNELFEWYRMKFGSNFYLKDIKDLNEKILSVSAKVSPAGCELSRRRVDYTIPTDIIPSWNSTYLEKICLPAKSAEHTTKLWPVVKNYILVGHVLEVIDASSLSSCMLACLKAEKDYGFKCRSGMWYPNDEDQNCLLNSENRQTQPNVFVEEDIGTEMLYFDVPLEKSLKIYVADIFFRDAPLEDDDVSYEFTRWSSCKNSFDGMQHRYLKCNNRKDIRKCPKQSLPCRKVKVKSLIGTCLAVRDSLGRKRCPHGMRRIGTDRREYCKHPVDC